MLRANTKQALADALLELVQTAPVRKIKVTNIVQRCGAARVTFYKHFRDKHDLIGWVYKEKMTAALANSPISSWPSTLTSIAHCIAESPDLFRALLEDEHRKLLDQAYSPIEEYWHKVLRAHYRDQIIPIELLTAVRFTRAGLIQTMNDWVLSGCQLPADELANIIAQLTPYCLYVMIQSHEPA
jgi:Transcriptional regulator